MIAQGSEGTAERAGVLDEWEGKTLRNTTLMQSIKVKLRAHVPKTHRVRLL